MLLYLLFTSLILIFLRLIHVWIAEDVGIKPTGFVAVMKKMHKSFAIEIYKSLENRQCPVNKKNPMIED